MKIIASIQNCRKNQRGNYIWLILEFNQDKVNTLHPSGSVLFQYHDDEPGIKIQIRNLQHQTVKFYVSPKGQHNVSGTGRGTASYFSALGRTGGEVGGKAVLPDMALSHHALASPAAITVTWTQAIAALGPSPCMPAIAALTAQALQGLPFWNLI